jgi:hypothetical protein
MKLKLENAEGGLFAFFIGADRRLIAAVKRL